MIICDISKWSGEVNFDQMAKNASAVIYKIGQGIYEDVRFSENHKNSDGVIPRAGYWYYDNFTDPNRQAEKCFELTGEDLPVFVDYEDPYEAQYAGWSKLYTFIVKAQELGVNIVGIYSTYYYWLANSPQYSEPSLTWFKQFPFWLAAYNTKPFSEQKIPAPWDATSTILWQYTASGDQNKYGVSSQDIDLNLWVGTDEQFTEIFGDSGSDGSDDDTPDGGDDIDEDAKYTATVTERSGMKVRNAPGTFGDVITKIGFGTKILASEIIPQPEKQAEWLHIIDIDGDPFDGYVAAVYNNVVYVEYEPIDGGDDSGDNDTPVDVEKAVIYFTDGTTKELWPK